MTCRFAGIHIHPSAGSRISVDFRRGAMCTRKRLLRGKCPIHPSDHLVPEGCRLFLHLQFLLRRYGVLHRGRIDGQVSFIYSILDLCVFLPFEMTHVLAAWLDANSHFEIGEIFDLDLEIDNIGGCRDMSSCFYERNDSDEIDECQGDDGHWHGKTRMKAMKAMTAMNMKATKKL